MPETNECYKLDNEQYMELKNFCLKYHDKKMKIETVLQAGGAEVERQSKIEGVYSNPTENKAIAISDITDDCKLIEKILLRVCGDYKALTPNDNDMWLYDFMLMNVTRFTLHSSYDGLKRCGYKIPICRNKFYYLRYKFFYELNKKYVRKEQ